MRDKLTAFILKHPPEQKKSGKDKKAMRRAEKERIKEGEAADEEMKKLKKKAAGTSKEKVLRKKEHSSPPPSQDENEQAESEEDDDDDDDVHWQTDTSREAAEKRMKEQLSAATADMVMLTTIEEEKKPEVKVKKSQVPPVKLQENGDGKIHEDAHEKLVTEIKELLSNGLTPSQLKTALASNSASHKEKMEALLSALFGDGGKGFAKEVVKKKKYLMALMVMMQEEAGSPQQMVLLKGIESFCAKANPEAAKEVALVIKGLYDEDMLDEDLIFGWYDAGNKSSPVMKKVAPFIEWLKNAESESEEE
jgi:translation initiation factor 5